MTTMFRIPLLSPSIPKRIVPISGQRREARLAMNILDAGLMSGRLTARHANDPLHTCQAQLQGWIRDRLQDLQCLQIGFRLRLGTNRPLYFGETIAEAADEALVTWFAECNAFAVGAALDRLEQIEPGLGASVLSVIDEKSALLVPVFTPWDVMCTAQEHYWYGETDEREALAERCAENEAEREAIREEMVTRDKIDAAFPAWATEWTGRRQRLARRALQRIGREARSPRVRAVVQDTLALSRLEMGDEYRPDIDGWFLGFGAVLTWRTSDIAVRVFDDYANEASQGDFGDWMGEFRFDLDDADAVRTWADAMEVRFEGIRLLDRLIHSLSTGDWRHVRKECR